MEQSKEKPAAIFALEPYSPHHICHHGLKDCGKDAKCCEKCKKK